MKTKIASILLISLLFLSLVVHINLAYSQTTNPESPLKQFKDGSSVNDIKCEAGLVLIIKKSDSSPACVKMQTAQKLIEREWATMIVDNTSKNVVLSASFMPCDTPYAQTNTSSIFLYMPMNSIGKLCVGYFDVINSHAPVRIKIFAVNNTDNAFQNAPEITILPSANTISTDTTVVYTIKTGNYSGFYGLEVFCGGIPFAVGSDSNSVMPNDFAGLNQQPFCPGASYSYHIVGLTGIEAKHFQ